MEKLFTGDIENYNNKLFAGVVVTQRLRIPILSLLCDTRISYTERNRINVMYEYENR